MSVPTNLIPTKVTGLPEYTGSSTLGFMPYIIDGRTYKVQFSNIASVGAVPSSRVIAAGTGLAGGGNLSADRVISIAAGGVGFDQLALSGVAQGTYGSGSAIPILTVDAKGRVTSATTATLDVTGFVPNTRTILAGDGLVGGGALVSNLTFSANFSAATPAALGAASAGTAITLSRGDHVHPAVNLSEASQTQGALPLGRGGTGDALSPVAGAVVYSTGTKFALSNAGIAGQVLMSNGTDEPQWTTVSGIGTVTSVNLTAGTGISVSGGPITTAGSINVVNTAPDQIVSLTGGGLTSITGTYPNFTITSSGGTGTVSSVDASGGTTGLSFTGGPITTSGTLTLGGTLAVANGGTGATSAATALTNLGAYPASNPAGYTSNVGTVTSVSGTGTVSGLSLSGTVTSSGSLTLSGTLAVLPSNFASQAANTVLAAPNGAAGVPTFRAIVAADIPTLNQNTTGTASNVTGTVAIANGGTGSTTAAGARTNLGATTVGANFFTVANPSAITFARVNADNTVSLLDAATFRTAIGAGTGGGSVTSVSGAGTVSGLTLSGTVTTSGSLTLGGTLAVTPSDFASQTANTFLAAPNGSAGTPTFRNIVAADVPTLNQNTTGTASNVTGIVAVANGGTGASVAATARSNLSAAASGANTDITSIALTTGTISTSPTGGTDIVNKAYADSIASGINFHQSVRLATVVALPANTYNNGTGGVGATLTANANGALSVDGVAAVVGNRILVKNEAAQANNGVYTVTQTGSGAAVYILTRATDFDSSGSGVDQIDAGDFFLVTAGSTQSNTSWVQQTPLPITVGTTAIVFSQFAAPVLYSAGTGLSLAGTVFSITNTGVTASTYGSASSVPVLAINAQGQVTSASSSSIAIAASQITSGALAVANGGTGATDASGALTNLGAYPASNPAGYTTNTGTVTSINLTAGTGVSVSGGPVTTSGSITVTNTAPDQVVSLTGSGATTVTGTYPNFTISSTAGTGTVTSVAASGGTTGLSFTGSPITTAGTFTLGGTLNVANGGTGATTLSSGYVLKGNGTSAVSASVIYDDGTNVAIGSPTARGNLSIGTYTATPITLAMQLGYTAADYYGFRVTNLSNAAALAAGTFSIQRGTTAAWVDALTISNAGNVTAPTDMRAPIFYDSDNTAFYFDGAASTNINALYGNGKEIFATADSYLRINESAGFSNGIWMSNSNFGGGAGTFHLGSNGGPTTSRIRIIGGTYNGATVITLNGADGVGTSTASWRAPIFYDSDDTNYYVDANSISVLSVVRTASIQRLAGQTILNFNSATYTEIRDPSGRNAILLGNSGDQSNYYDNAAHNFRNVAGTLQAQIYGTGTILALSDVRAPIFYDYDNTAYYLDAANNSVFSNVQNGVNYTSGGGGGRLVVGPGSPYSLRQEFGSDNTGWRYGIAKNVSTTVTDLFYVQDNGSVTATGDFRAPVFYDSNNTAYYVDPASTSNLNDLIVASGAVIGAAATFNNMNLPHTTYGDANNVGFGFRYLQGGSNYPGIPSATQYYGMTLGLGSDYAFTNYASQFYWPRTSTGGLPYPSVRFREGGTWSAWSKIYAGWADAPSGATFAATGDFRAPIFYDSDNTAYYMDLTGNPSINAAGSILAAGNLSLLNGANRQVIIGSATNYNYALSTVNDDFQILEASTTPRLTIKYPNGNVGVGTTNPAVKFVVSNGGAAGIEFDPSGGLGGGSYIQSFNRSTTAYTPNTNYAASQTWYAGTTRAMDLDASGVLLINRTSTSGYGKLNVEGGADFTGGNVIMCRDSGNVSIGTVSASAVLDVKSQINVTSPSNVSMNAVRASNFGYSTSYSALILGSTSGNNTPCINVDPIANPSGSFSGSGGEVMFRNSVYFITPNTANNGYHSVMQLSDGNAYFGNIAQATASVRAPIFYDSNNTAYYVDPESGSVLGGQVSFAGGSYVATNGDFYARRSSGTTGVYYFADGGSKYLYWDGGQYIFGSAGPVTTAVDMRAPIFYDANNTAYYIDAASNSVLNTLTLGGRSTEQVVYYSGFTLDANTMPGNSTGFTYSVNAPFTGPVVSLGNASYTLQLNAPYSVAGYGLAFRTRNGDTSTFNPWRYPAVYDVNVNGGGALYATIYYDSADTSRFVDPLGVSTVNILNTAGYIQTYSGGVKWDESGVRSWSMFPSGGGIGLSSGDGGGSFTVGLSGGTRSPIFYDSNDTAYYLDAASTSNLNAIIINGQSTMATQKTFVASNYGHGVYGVYSAEKYQHVWSMGTDYNLPANGLSTGLGGNLYGLAWSYDPGYGAPGNNAQSKAGLLHQLLLMMNGTTYFAAGNGVWTSGIGTSTASWRAPIFYDSDNTAYYIDPASTGTSLTVAGNVLVAGGLGVYDSAGNDPYGKISVTRNADANSYSYYGLTRAGQLGAGFGIDTSNRFWWGSATAGYAGAASAIGMTMTMGGTLSAAADMRAPIFYDSNDTTYYIDPNADTSVRVYGEICNSSYAVGALQPGALNIGRIDLNYGWAGTTWASDIRLGLLANCSETWEFGIHDSGDSVMSALHFDGGTQFIIGRDIGWGTCYLTNPQSMRSPIFYDSDNTGYYVDPASGTRLGGQLEVLGSRPLTYAASGGLLSIQGDAGGWATGTYFLGSSGTNFGGFGGTGSGNTFSYLWAGSAYNDAALYLYPSPGNYAVSPGSFRAPIFYDNDNTAYYLDAASTGTSLNVAGSIIAAGNVTAYSDIRVKANVETIPSALDKLDQIRGVTYTRTDLEDKDRRYAGVIAQELEAVLPEAVCDLGNIKAVDYNATIALLIQAVKELRDEVQALRK